jgi:glycyl-tRNA synthetase
MANTKVTLEKLVSFCKQRGFVFPGSDIYGGLANTWDYGPLGVSLKNNVKKVWWNYFVKSRPDMVGLESSILMNPKVWEASGHLQNFSDPLIDDKNTKKRYRGDHVLEEILGPGSADGKTGAEITALIREHQHKSDTYKDCEFTEARNFNLMFKTFQGVIEETAAEIFMRPETAQGMFVNFKNVQGASRKRLPFGIAQIGKSFRNEITPGNFTFRTREFEQMEIEYFVEPGTEKEHYQKWKEDCMNWFLKYGITKENLRFRDHSEDELSHYSNGTTDIEYEYSWGWGELLGVASRTDFDLNRHQEHSGQDLTYMDPHTNKKFIPYVVEPAFGCDRTVLTFLMDAYDEEELEGGDTRVVMRFHKDIAPVQVAILPLMRKDGLVEKSHEVWKTLCDDFTLQMDETQSIGKRYRRQDEIGTPYCITVDYDSLEDNTVTVRDRDTMEQGRVKIEELKAYLKEKFEK